tara:strand:+ start:5316 stop:5615 length:300 start_codon:yes stop_codon:yes gene_type:complete
MEKLDLTFIDNASHGYLKVSKYDLLGWNIKPSEFSEYSYYNKENACLYLEEDCDFPKFIKLIEDKGYIIRNNEGYIDVKTIQESSYYFDSNEFIRNRGV